MDESPADANSAGRESRTWEARNCVWQEDEAAGQLGQRNPDDNSTRTKITHIEGLGYGLIGSVHAVVYGTWFNQSAMLLVLGFDFRARKGFFRYKNAHISISFNPGKASNDRTSDTTNPVVCAWHPRNNKPSRRQTNTSDGGQTQDLSNSGSALNPDTLTEKSIWPLEEFWIRGRSWSNKRRQEPHEVIWDVTETDGNITGISDEIRLAIIVTYSEPFCAVTDVRATIGLGLTVRSFPWSRDDPLPFDGHTVKGRPISTLDFSAITNQEFFAYLSDANLSFMNSPQADITANLSSVPMRESVASNKTSGAVYRVRGLPFFWSRHTFTQTLSASMKVREDSIRVNSFTVNPYRLEKMAIISFEELQSELVAPNKRKEWLVQARPADSETMSERPDDRIIQLLFDTHFFGFSELGTPTVDPSMYIADIIAIGGLGGHGYGSFKERGGTHMWLQDSLVSDLQTPNKGIPFPGAPRILIYGYDTHIENSQSFQSITDLASQLRMSLRAVRLQDSCRRPIIFIGHSLGGIVIKELLILLSKGDEVDQCNFKSTRGALFFGVPNRGIDNSSLTSMIGSQPNKDLLKSLDIDSPFLKQQAESFSSLFNFRDSVIFSFFETCVSPKAIMVDGKLSMTGERVVLVTKDSATHSRLWENDPRFIIAVDRNHSDLVKFERGSSDYEHVLTCIRLLLEDASDIISRRFGA